MGKKIFANGIRQNVLGFYLPGGSASEIFWGLLFIWKKVIAGGSRRKFSGFISSFGKKKLSLAATGEKILGVIFHMVKNDCWREPAKNF